MGNLYSVLNSASQSLQAFEKAIDVTQNNVTNANSPGYADQVPQMISAGFPIPDGHQLGRSSGRNPGHSQQLRRHRGAAAIVAARHVSAAPDYPGAAPERLRCLFQQPHSVGAESVVPELFAMEHPAQQRELPIGGHRRGPANRQRIPASRGSAWPNPDLYHQRYSIHGYPDQSGCGHHPDLQPGDSREPAGRRRIERANREHPGKSFRPGEHPGAPRQRRHGDGAAGRPDHAGAGQPGELCSRP